MKVIGISAKAGCGKSTVSKYLVNYLGCGKLSFGDGVKEECSKFTNLPIEYFYDVEIKNELCDTFFGTIIPRKFMQAWGTDFRRKADSDYWVKYLQNKLFEMPYIKENYIVVDDVRFINEANWINNMGGLLIRIEPYEGYNNLAEGHVSETELDDYKKFDLVFYPRYGYLYFDVFIPTIKFLKGE